jgi:ribosome-associated protein
MDSLKLALLCHELADNKKAEKILILDVRKISSVTDFYVLVSGSSEPHIRAIIGELRGGLLDRMGLRPASVDGEHPTSWQVLDYFDVIIHVMKPDVRERYDIEGLWGDAPRIDPANPPSEEKKKPAKKKAAAKKTEEVAAAPKKAPAKKPADTKNPAAAPKKAAPKKKAKAGGKPKK